MDTPHHYRMFILNLILYHVLSTLRLQASSILSCILIFESLCDPKVKRQRVLYVILVINSTDANL